MPDFNYISHTDPSFWTGTPTITVSTKATTVGAITLEYLAVLPKKVIFNGPATIVFWDDGDKTVVKCQEGDAFDEREGFLLCCAKKLMGGGRYNDAMREHGIPDRHGCEFSMLSAWDSFGDVRRP